MIKRLVVSLVAIVTLSACAQQPVSVDYEPAVDFSVINSYAWATEGQAAFGSSNDGLMDRRVKEVLKDELAMRGVKFNQDAPDMLIGYQVIDQEKVDFYSYPRFYSYGHHHRYFHSGFYDELIVYRYDQRRFLLDVMDSQYNLIWRGVYTDLLKNASTPDERVARIREQVSEILLHFPR
ncbi:MAG: DUF4136 domain-containing protein [Amphritea sp.]